MTSITVTDLSFDRPDFRLGPITLALPAASKTALVGPSGAGKSTLLRCLAGLEPDHCGQIHFGERLVAGGGATVAPDQRGIGYVFQRGALWPHMTALQHIQFVAPALSRDEALGWLGRVGLDRALAARRPSELSGGEAQRLALARALAPAPTVLLLDEPLASVDVHLRDELALLVRDLADERRLTVVVITHARDEALSIADDLVVLHGGKVIEQGRASELARAPRTAFCAAFLGATCLEVASDGNGRVVTPFGAVAAPAGPGPWSLVLLPGDLTLRDDGPAARVISCEPLPRGYKTRAALAGRAVEILTDAPARPGNELRLGLTGAPRVLANRMEDGP